MSIELTLERIAAALEKIAATSGPRPVVTTGTITEVEPRVVEADPVPEKRGRGRPPKAKVEAAPEPTPEPAEEFDEPPVETKVSREDVRAALIDYQKRASPERARSLLKQVGGVDTLSALPEAKFAAVVAATKP